MTKMHWRGWVVAVALTAALPNFMPSPARGVIIEEVDPNAAAAQAGLKAGDRLLTYDGKPLPSPAALSAAQQNTFGKKDVAVRVQRGGDTLTLTVPVKALGMAVRPELPPDALRLYEEGSGARQTQKTDEVIAKWMAAAKAAQEGGDKTAAAWLYGRGGEVYESQRKWREAREAHAAAWELLKESSDTAAQSRALSALGRCSRNLNDFPAAERWYERARQVDAAAGNEMWAAYDLTYMGVAASYRGDLTAAHDCHTRALAMMERLAPDSLDVAMSLNNLGGVAYYRGDLTAALDYHSRALRIRERLAPDSLDVATSLNNLGIVARDRGDLEAAHDYYARALTIFKQVAPDSLSAAMTLNNIGNVARDRGDLEAAHNYFTRALTIFERLAPNSLTVAMNLNNLGNVARDRGDLEAAHDFFTRALAIKERLAPDSLTVAATLTNLGSVAYNRSDLAAAGEHFARALDICERRAPDTLDVALNLNNLGNVARDRGDLTAAHNYFTRAHTLFERLAAFSLTVADSLHNLGTVAYLRGDLTAARDYFTRAIAVVETHRRQIPSAEPRALLVAKNADKYTSLLRTDLALNDLPAAFATLERARARSLVELLAKRRLNLRADAPADLLKRQDELDQQRSAAYRQLGKLDPQNDGEQIEQLLAQLATYTTQQKALESQIRDASPQFAALLYPTPLDLDGARTALDPGTLLLAYYVDDKETYLFAVHPSSLISDARVRPHPSSLQLFRLKVTAQALREKVNRFRETLTGRSQGSLTQQGQALYDLLVRPAQRLVRDAQRVLICPDGPLHGLPFAALVVEKKAKGKRQKAKGETTPQPTVRYFVEDKPLHTIVSMTVYAEIHKAKSEIRNPKSEMQLLAFGDPIYTREQWQARGKPVKTTQKWTSRNQADNPMRWDPLPHTRREVEAIARLHQPYARTYLGKDATEATAKRLMPGADRLHFACHGFLDEKFPLQSALVLTQPEALGSKPQGDDDGSLRVWEIFEQAHLRADLVVLSACDTGLGQEVAGEGLKGLTRAFLYAGADSLIVSLWGVNDPSTAALMERFYRELKNGAPKDVALQRAMVLMRHDPRNATWRNPRHWAPFILVGNWR